MTPLDVPPSVPISYAVFDGLRAIQSTQYEHSFAARIYGHTPPRTPGLIAVDWGHSSWMTFTLTIRLHSQSTHLCIWVCVHITMLTLSFSSPERDQPEQLHTPITYVSLRPSHLPQVHDLLERVFGDGIDGKHALLPFFSSDPTADHILTPVSDALHYAPERSTVITMYDHLVVGAAFLSSPQETYITYLVVRAGWENAQIATYFTFFFSVPTSRTELDPRRTMLYHLIALHPHRDITLHVSANNPAMVRHCLPSFIFRECSYRRWSAIVQPVRIQSSRVHRRVL